MKIVKQIQLKIIIFTAMKNRCMLHGRVCVMNCMLGAIQTEIKDNQLTIFPYFHHFPGARSW